MSCRSRALITVLEFGYGLLDGLFCFNVVFFRECLLQGFAEYLTEKPEKTISTG